MAYRFRFAFATAFALLLGGAVLPAAAQTIATTPEDFEAVSDTVKITAIDKAARSVTVQNAAGKTFDIVAGAEVRNFDLIKVGDLVVAVYYQGLSFTVSKPGTKIPTAVVTDDVARAKKGQLPAGGVSESIALTAMVTSVDVANNTVNVVDQNGGMVRTLKVNNPERQAYLKNLKPGDLITATLTRAVAVAVVTAPQM